eukprot:CAMPEP_0201488092 /NCGR_PEP_ID=MMETSP0151_2-20130828/16838_1 /ASSEMBLY_ACC=CAM_ASM_000257 /TAXON_ID=200890 /ORGANISM="Paramoeba atlantica, Strain 621/1 / CCAP 1560/9" /LENGTH=66 /DNA_ID=CAMNT_0047873311 /DNA_START=82 /DNA_END=279 /DNA_ORIENTATION=+
MTKTFCEKWVKWHLRVASMSLLASVPLYLFTPNGTAIHWGGEPSPTSDMWIRGRGAADLALGFLAW